MQAVRAAWSSVELVQSAATAAEAALELAAASVSFLLSQTLKVCQCSNVMIMMHKPVRYQFASIADEC
jgi:hypothetical protein